MTNRKTQAKNITEAIRQVLIRDWDPIGVMGDPEWPRDEYDTYVGVISRSLASDESVEFIARQLCSIEETMMGFRNVQVSSRLSVAKKLKALDVSLQK